MDERAPARDQHWGPHQKDTDFDIDITEQAAADAIEWLVRDRYADCGVLLARFGRAPKRAIPFRTDKPFKKITANLVAPSGELHRLEFLGDGQQFVVDGVQPDTRKPYSWFGGELASVKREDLPCIDESEARQLVDDAVELLVAEHGYALKRIRSRSTKIARRRATRAIFSGSTTRRLQYTIFGCRNLFPEASGKPAGACAYRRHRWAGKLEEDISFSPEGIKDFGVHDMGDPRGGKRTPIDVVMEWHPDLKVPIEVIVSGGAGAQFNDAVTWLWQALGHESDWRAEFDPHVARLNERYALVLVGDKAVVMQTPADGGIKFLTLTAFDQWFENKFVQRNDKKVPLAKHWRHHPQRRQYEGIVFTPKRDAPGHYNLWRGFAVEARQGDCSKFLAHLKDNVCCGNDSLRALVGRRVVRADHATPRTKDRHLARAPRQAGRRQDQGRRGLWIAVRQSLCPGLRSALRHRPL